MNEGRTGAMVYDALFAGFQGVDTANHYRNGRGVARAIADATANGFSGSVWLQTKIEGCGNSVDPRSRILRGSCYEDTLAVFDASLDELAASTVDLALLHAPPCVPGADWNQGCGGPEQQDAVYPHLCDCAAAEPCEMIQQQWRALEAMYSAGRTRSIGVSNYCRACLECIAKVSSVEPHVNQLQLHAGMAGPDPAGLVSYSRSRGIAVQAYRPLAQVRLLHDDTLQRIALRRQKSTAQVASRWVVQLGHALVTTTENKAHMAGAPSRRRMQGVRSALLSATLIVRHGARAKSVPRPLGPSRQATSTSSTGRSRRKRWKR